MMFLMPSLKDFREIWSFLKLTSPLSKFIITYPFSTDKNQLKTCLYLQNPLSFADILYEFMEDHFGFFG
jgi:hypothetical protein